MKPTRVSPFSFLIFGGRPAGNACWKTSMSPVLAALYIFPANSITAGGISPLAGLVLVLSAMVSYKRERTIQKICLSDRWNCQMLKTYVLASYDDIGPCHPRIPLSIAISPQILQQNITTHNTDKTPQSCAHRSALCHPPSLDCSAVCIPRNPRP